MLETATAPTTASSDQPRALARECFEVRMSRGFAGLRRYQVYCFEPAILMLDLGPLVSAGQRTGMVVGGVLGGVIGASIGNSLGKSLTPEQTWERNLQTASDETIMQLARERKSSLVVKTDEIESVAINAPKWYEGVFNPQSLVGFINLRDVTYGKLKLEVHDAISMNTAANALPRVAPSRVDVNVYFDTATCRFCAHGG